METLRRNHALIFVSLLCQTLTAGGEGRESTELTNSGEEEKEEVGEDGGEEGEGVEAVDDIVGDDGDEHDQLKQQDEMKEDEEPGSIPETQQTGFVSSDVISATSRHKHLTLVPYGLPCVRELLRFLASFINMRER